MVEFNQVDAMLSLDFVCKDIELLVCVDTCPYLIRFEVNIEVVVLSELYIFEYMIGFCA